MSEILASIDARDVMGLSLLAIVVLQHAGTAGIRAAMGRDGRVDHTRIELVGAVRGTVAIAALLAPVGVVWALDALSSPARFQVYMDANEAMLWLWIPVTIVALISFLVARVSPWQVRSNLNSMLFSMLELFRPLVAAAGMAIGALATADWRVAGVGAFAIGMSLQVAPLTRRWWYSTPVTLNDLGPP